MSEPFEVALTGDEEKRVEVDANDQRAAMAVAEEANPGYAATGASVVRKSFHVSLRSPDDGWVSVRVTARDPMDAKRIAEAQEPGFEMYSCTEQ